MSQLREHSHQPTITSTNSRQVWPSQIIGHLAVLVIVSLWLCLELFLHPTQPQTFDGWTHLSTLYHFARIWTQGGWPVTWVDGVANYGHPLGLVAHQVTSYVGALLVLGTGQLLTGYAALAWLGAGASAVSMYWFLSHHVSPRQALVATILFNFAPYRIMNLYLRGAIPEFWAAVWIPIMLVGINWWWLHRRPTGLILGSLGVTGLALTHPMMMLPASALIGGYCLFLWLSTIRQWSKLPLRVLGLGLMGGLGLALASYYLVPLFMEMKYFYYGQMSLGGPGSSFNFLNVSNFFTEAWRYTEIPGNGVRAPILQLGVFEMAIWIVADLKLLSSLIWRRTATTCGPTLPWLGVWFSVGVVMALLSLPISLPLYQNFELFAGLQHPWRWLTALSFIAPLLFAQLLEETTVNHSEAKLNWRWLSAVAIVLVGVAWWRFPQLYGKNRVWFEPDRYGFVIVNPHSTNMNPVWTAPSWEYPVRDEKLALVEGEGSMTEVRVGPADRYFKLEAKTPVRIADYSFYFPGWTVTANGQDTPIEYQDPDYRGVITYRLPAGNYEIREQFQLTKWRWLGWGVTSLAVLGWLSLWGWNWYFQRSNH